MLVRFHFQFLKTIHKITYPLLSSKNIKVFKLPRNYSLLKVSSLCKGQIKQYNLEIISQSIHTSNNFENK